MHRKGCNQQQEQRQRQRQQQKGKTQQQQQDVDAAAAAAEPNQDWEKGAGGKKFICCICKNFHAVNKQWVEGRQEQRGRLASSREKRRLCSPFERTHMWEAERQRGHGTEDWGLGTGYSAAYYTQKERRREQLALTEMKRNVTWKLQAAPLPPTLMLPLMQTVLLPWCLYGNAF